MLNIEQLKKNIEDAGGKWSPDPSRPCFYFEFIKDEDENDIIATLEWMGGRGQSIRKATARLFKHNFDDTRKFYDMNGRYIYEIAGTVELANKIAKHIGFEIDMPIKEVEVEKIVEREIKNEKEEARLGGMVEAYEKILTGREFTAK